MNKWKNKQQQQRKICNNAITNSILTQKNTIGVELITNEKKILFSQWNSAQTMINL